MTALTATIETAPAPTDAGAFEVLLRVENSSGGGVEILNPDMGVPAPDSGWPHSADVYRVAMLLSYGYLTLTVVDAEGREVAQQAIQTWATPVLRPKVRLEPGEAMTLPIPLATFYALTPGVPYDVTVGYGDHDLKVAARARLTMP
jgi:hypothetical protein